jgi:hypothetical protein
VALLDRQFEHIDAVERAQRAAEQKAAEAQADAYQKFLETASKWDAAFAEFRKMR